MGKILALLALCACLGGCGYTVDSSDAVRAAQNLGFSDIVIDEEWRLMPSVAGCGKDDDAGFKLRAINPANKWVRITVCCGWLMKGCTVRSQ